MIIGYATYKRKVEPPVSEILVETVQFVCSSNYAVELDETTNNAVERPDVQAVIYNPTNKKFEVVRLDTLSNFRSK
jgi:hypothetical protein